MLTCRRCLIRQRTRKYSMNTRQRCGALKIFTVAAILLCYVIIAYVTIRLTMSSSRVLHLDAANTRQNEILRSFIKDSVLTSVVHKSNNTLPQNITRALQTESNIMDLFTRKLKSTILSSMFQRNQTIHRRKERVISQDKSCFYSGLNNVPTRSTSDDKFILNGDKYINEVNHKEYQETDEIYSNSKQEIKDGDLRKKYNEAVNESVTKCIDNIQCNRFITISSAMGRTGNQLFQVAAVIGTAYRYNLIPVLPQHFPLLRYFNLSIKTIKQPLNNTVVFGAEKPSVYKQDIEHLNVTRNLTLDGFFQSWKYFSEVAEIVRDIIQLKARYLNESRAFLKSVYKPGRVNVCVHVRRGDMLRQTAKNDGYKIADKSFFPKAMDYYRNRFKDVLFIIISDGMFWCKQHLVGKDIVYSPFYEAATDMALMTSCDHVIVTSGTFGWWGAWLTRGITVYYSGYPANGTMLDRNMNRSDYYPKEWIGII